MTGPMTHNTLLTRGKGKQIKTKLTRGGIPKEPVHHSHEQEREGRLTPTLLPFVRPSLLHASTFRRMLCGPKRFLSDLILTLNWCLRKESDREEKSLHYHTIPSFASPKSPFGPQLGSRKTPPVSQLSTEDHYCPRT